MTTGMTDVERVREAIDLVSLIGEHVPLRPRGREHVGLCPFHDDHTPSMAVVTHKGNAFYKCHACGAAGDAFNFVMAYHRKDFAEALTFLAERAGITLSRSGDARRRRDGDGPSRADIRAANAFAARLFQRGLESGDRGAAAVRLLHERGIDDAMTGVFGLGLAPEGYSGLLETLRGDRTKIRDAAAAGLLKCRDDGGHYDTFRNRITFPICDELGQVIAFGARAIAPDDQPKYLNSPESPIFAKSATLYGLHLARRPIIDSNVAIVTEGYTDVIACHREGFTNAIATLGTALTSDHARILAKLCNTVVLVFDGDEAGQRAADRALEVFFQHPVEIRICVLPDGQDPDDLLRSPDGPARFRAAVAESREALAHKVDRITAELHGQESLAGREKLLQAFLHELAGMGFNDVGGVRKRLIFGRLAELLGVSLRDIEQMMPRQRRQPAPAGHGAAEAGRQATIEIEPAEQASRARRLAERELLAILLYDTEAGMRQIEMPDGTTVAAHAACTAEDFRDPAARQIAELVLPQIAAGRAVSIPELLHSLPASEHRSIATDLYLEGRRIHETATGEEFETAVAWRVEALRSCIKNERFRQSMAPGALRGADAGQQLEILNDLLEQRRRCGDMPTAITAASRT